MVHHFLHYCGNKGLNMIVNGTMNESDIRCGSVSLTYSTRRRILYSTLD